VIAASNEFFAEKENLIRPEAPAFTPGTFGHKGQVYDGWETRRRRGPSGALPGPDAHDWAVVRLGAPGVIRAVVVETAFFTGNYPEGCSVDACSVAGYPAILRETAWEQVVPRRALKGDARHVLRVSSGRRYTHVRLNVFPDGGVARLRVHGEVIPDPDLLTGLTIDLAALENGADITGCSDRFYSSPRNAISPGLSRVMGEGWETRRRRDPGNDWLVVRLAGAGVVSLAEIDTSGYKGNAPAAAALRGVDGRRFPLGDETAWFDLLPVTALLPDTPHRFRVDGAGTPAHAVTHVRLNVFPDGGVARLRLYGSLTEDGADGLRRRWRDSA